MTEERCLACRAPAQGLYCDRCRRPVIPASAESEQRGNGITEAGVQDACRRLLLADGWRVWRVGQRNARGTQDPGVADLLCFHPRVGIWFVEMKTPTGAQSVAQRQFELAVRAAGGRYDLIWSVEQLRLRLQVLRAAADTAGAAC